MDLAEKHTDALAKGVGVLMTAGGAATGFALHETSSWTLAPSLYVAATATILWCLSFASGIFRSDAIENTLRANLTLNLAMRNKDPEATQIEHADQFFEMSRRQVKWRRAQLWLLLAGAPIYLVGNTMHLREKQLASHKANSPNSSPANMPIQPHNLAGK
ncbi:hypothetical protein [Sphingomonas sp. CFBP 13733]|uniref:hypothetical protein n=1 Tax=Sphingomonas sp. CFBP 13733 TaxID=2775291 RepID=UPI0017808ACF|nr:hypothetical protein [Sphingomonas sp. CFBP 13733]MBD8641151.1 hypothetical protein [Sphingomonas sp. CFBP 13733]